MQDYQVRNGQLKANRRKKKAKINIEDLAMGKQRLKVRMYDDETV